jgi:hypothetical protein
LSRDGGSDRSPAEEFASERESRVQEQRRKYEEERRRREAEMARVREEERSRLRETERSRAQQFQFTSMPAAPGIRDVSTVSIETSSISAPPPQAQPHWDLAQPPREMPTPAADVEAPVPPPAMVVRRPEPRPAPATPLSAFLAIDAREGFDLIGLGASRLPELVTEAHEDADVIRELGRRAEQLEARARQEAANTVLVGSFLRDRAVEWFRDSPFKPEWRDAMSRRWGGLFAESRVPGGKLQPWIASRLRQLREECVRAAGWKASLRDRLGSIRGAKKEEERTRYQVLVTEVAQAILDDMASRHREPDRPLPLVRLSELAQRWDSDTVNQALADLFGGPERGPFVVLHPSRYPDCDLVAVRPPPPTAQGAMRSYDLVATKAGAPLAGQSLAGGSAPTQPGSGSSPWEAPDVSEDSWKRMLESVAARKDRLDAPPKDCRTRAGFATLRALLLRDREARLAFLAAKWRGRPAGLPLLAQLLADGVLEPKVATDHEYIEAELGDLERRDLGYSPADLKWSVPGWKVRREGDFKSGLRYVAEAV